MSARPGRTVHPAGWVCPDNLVKRPNNVVFEVVKLPCIYREVADDANVRVPVEHVTVSAAKR